MLMKGIQFIYLELLAFQHIARVLSHIVLFLRLQNQKNGSNIVKMFAYIHTRLGEPFI